MCTFLFFAIQCLIAQTSGQDFLSFISPFVGSGLPSSGGPQPATAASGANANGIQGIVSAFSNSGGATSNNPFMEFATFGQSLAGLLNAGKGGAQQPPAPTETQAEPQSQTKRFARARSYSPSRRQYSPSQRNPPARSNSAIGRLVDNFGRNFNGLLDELHTYAKQPLPPGPAPIQPNPNAITAADSPQAPTPADLLDANNLMRAFLRTMSRDASSPLRPLPAVYDGTEMGQNRPLMDQLFESDILLTSRQMKAIVLAEAERRGGNRRRLKRKVITGAAYRWPKGAPIPYSFREPDKKWRQTITSGLKLWEKETCIRFREDGFGKDRLEFIRGSGCYSSVGRTGGTQKVSIGFGCEDKGIVSHEVGHALGFWHEQSRYDRDQYIKLDDQYIAGGTEGNFAKRSDLEIDGMGLPYDLGSVMHYGPQAFTTDWDHTTIITKDKKYQHTIGQRKGPSFIDVKQINRLYCHQTCVGTPVRCLNGGYADPNNCLRCKCPPGLGGASCELPEKTEGLFCGGDLGATPLWQHLTHKGKQRCVWRIKAPKARIRIILDAVNYQCDTTCHSFVEIKHNSDFQQIGFRSCCDEKTMEVLSEQDELLIICDATELSRDGSFTLRYIQDSGAPLPKPPPPAWVPGRENRPFRGVEGKGGVIEKFILNAIPKIRDPQKPVESVFSILTDYFASSLLGTSRDNRRK